jgi:hypothetical protein
VLGNERLPRLPKYLLLVVIAILLLDTLAVAAWVGWMPVPRELSDEGVARLATKVMIDYYRQMARSAGVHNTEAVKRALADMERSLKGKAVSETMATLVTQSHNVEAAIGSEKRRHQRETILRIIGRDPKIRGMGQEVGKILLTGQEVLEGAELLGSNSLKRLKKEPVLHGMGELVTVEVGGGKPRILSPPRNLEYYHGMELELEQIGGQLEKVRRASGEASLQGPGVIIKAADAPGGYLWDEIVHEQDIREIVNNLYFAGAKGVQIGGQRMGIGGWVRCVGPVVVVNGKTVAANPIVMEAVGDEGALRESLRELQEVFALTGKRLDIQGSDYLELVPR